MEPGAVLLAVSGPARPRRSGKAPLRIEAAPHPHSAHISRVRRANQAAASGHTAALSRSRAVVVEAHEMGGCVRCGS
jgi:hypothetical protein